MTKGSLASEWKLTIHVPNLCWGNTPNCHPRYQRDMDMGVKNYCNLNMALKPWPAMYKAKRKSRSARYITSKLFLDAVSWP